MADLTRKQLKEHAQEVIMNGIGNQLGYYKPSDDARPIPESQMDEFWAVMKREADRAGRLFGLDGAWVN